VEALCGRHSARKKEQIKVCQPELDALFPKYWLVTSFVAMRSQMKPGELAPSAFVFLLS